jgi:hypothetical protein
MFSTCWIWPLKIMPSVMKSMVQIVAATTSKATKRVQVMPSAPAIGAATTDTPGRNLAAISELPPQRVISVSLWRTHESGESEIWHKSFITRCPCQRPAWNQAPSPARLATMEPASTATHDSSPVTARPPATTSKGEAGTGAPMRAASVAANTMSTPCSTSSAMRSPMMGLLYAAP